MEILSEKYRPKTVDECVLPDEIKKQVSGLIESGNIPSMLFTGSAGCGKTTLARAIANETGADLLFINASMNNSIDDIRTTVTQFASTVSFTDAKKITVLDEADGLSVDAQKALRGLIEQFSSNHSIILTVNFASKVIEPIRSRCKVVDFKIHAKDKPLLAAKFIKRVYSILDTEKIAYEKEAVASLIMKKFPDFRSVLTELQGYAAGGKIDAGILLNLTEDSFNSLVASIKKKSFTEVKKWVTEHSDIDSHHMVRVFYDSINTKLEQKSIPEVIVLLRDFLYKDYFVADNEISRLAFLIEVMLNQNIVWK